MKFRSTISFVIIAALFLIIASCSDDDDGGNNMMNNTSDCTTTVSFANDVAPIINSACAISGCHVEGFASGDFRNYEGVKDRASRVSSRVEARTMPPSNSSGPSLSDSQIMTIACWVEQGAPNN